MSAHISEQEQLEQLKKWWARYGKLIVVSFLVALAVVLSWRYVQNREETSLNQASMLYQQVFQLASQSGTNEQVRANAQVLMSRYEKTPYASAAALLLAKLDIEANNYSAAQEDLRWVLSNGKESSLKQVARLRLARILIAEKRPQEALTLLNTVDNSAFVGVIDLVKGDALFSEGQKGAASEQYRLAMQVLPQNSVLFPIVVMKYNQLAGSENVTVTSKTAAAKTSSIQITPTVTNNTSGHSS